MGPRPRIYSLCRGERLVGTLNGQRISPAVVQAIQLANILHGTDLRRSDLPCLVHWYSSFANVDGLSPATERLNQQQSAHLSLVHSRSKNHI